MQILDEIDLAETSTQNPLKVLHRLLEDRELATTPLLVLAIPASSW